MAPLDRVYCIFICFSYRKEVQAQAETEKDFEDNFPPSKKAQVLREVLEQEYIDNIPPNINDMWTRFKEQRTHSPSQSESSLNSTRLNALSGLLQNPAHHTVNTYLDEKAEERDKKKSEAEQAKKIREEERQAEILRDEKLAAELAANERSLKRQELKQRHGLSEEESNGSYTEVIMEREKKKVKDRTKKREEQRGSKDGKTKTPEREKEQKKSRKDKENAVKENPERKLKHSKDRKREAKNIVERTQQSDSMDTLFSIAEDASFEASPSKAESDLKARQKRHRHVIDPLMRKLRDKIKLQRDKIDKERRKELQRVEKLKKLEMLLTAKRKGKLSDKAIDVELQDVSSTTSISQSESSMFSEATLTAGSTTMESDATSQASTTQDTIIEPPRLQYKKYPEKEAFMSQREKFSETDTSTAHSDTSDFSNIIVERVPDKRVERKTSSKKGKSKSKKAKKDESEHKTKRERKKKEVFGVELSDELLAKQLRRYERYISPERLHKHRDVAVSPKRLHRQRDVATMYPSPMTVSPPSRRRLKEVLMKSEAIQTSPSVRSTSPSYSYDEVPVAPVPLMAKNRNRRQSPSPSRSSPAPRKTSRSPADRSRSSGVRKSSKSPSVLIQTSISSPVSSPRTGSHSRKKKTQSPMWRPETPPRNQMFEPENPDENSKPFTEKEDIPQGK